MTVFGWALAALAVAMVAVFIADMIRRIEALEDRVRELRAKEWRR